MKLSALRKESAGNQFPQKKREFDVDLILPEW